MHCFLVSISVTSVKLGSNLNASHQTCVSNNSCNNHFKLMNNQSLTHWMLGLFALALSMQTGIASPAEKETKPLKAGYHEIKSKKAGKLLKEHKDLVVLDIRTMKEYVEGHIDKAKHIDFFEDSFKTLLEKLDRKTPYLVHCASGGRSGRSMEVFRDLGFTRIYHMNDGFKGWVKEKLPIKKGKPSKDEKKK